MLALQMSDTAMKAYVEARIAFGEHPDVRLRTDGDSARGAYVLASGWIAGQRYTLSYRVPHEVLTQEPYVPRGLATNVFDCALRVLAEDACRVWERKEEENEPWEPFTFEALDAVLGPPVAVPWREIPARVNHAWGDELRMHVGNDEIVLSPAAYVAVLKRRDVEGRYQWTA